MTYPNPIVQDARHAALKPLIQLAKTADTLLKDLSALPRYDLVSDEICGYNCSARMRKVAGGDYVSYAEVAALIKRLKTLS